MYVYSEELFGEIREIFQHIECEVNHIWFQVDLFPNHEIDPETRLPFARLDQELRTCIVKEENLSEPLIVGIDEGYIWFISINHKSDFT